ncbi:MAG TPA: type II toxin-antitoxin system RelE/ParE family toxin [Phycisphaerae bacterium]
MGDCRVVYSIDDATQTVSVVTIAHRRDAYK